MTTHKICINLVIFLLMISPLLAQVSNESVMGATFYGVNSDSSNNVINQVGPYADFAVPVNLKALSESTSLLPGESSKLEAVLCLDDGSISKLSSTKVSWATSSAELNIKDDFVTATSISHNTRISINATAEGYSAAVFIRLKEGSSNSDSISNSSNVIEGIISDSVSLSQSGWKRSEWFGNYFDAGNNWVHHQHHGWLYASASKSSSLWLWSPSFKWMWTGPGIYPHIFRNKDSSWMYFIFQALPLKVYYNQSTKILEKGE